MNNFLIRILSRLFTCVIIMCCNTMLWAQYVLSGGIAGSHQEPVTEALISLLNEPDSSVLQNTFPDSAGIFTMTVPDLQHKMLKVSAMGYRTVYRKIGDERSGLLHLDFVLETDNQSLEEVTIAAGKSVWERKTDRMIYNVSASITASGSNGLEVLGKAPGVLVQQAEYRISLTGKSGVLVLVNDRLLQLSGEDLFAYLQAMPAEQIDRIEVITTPPARYDAAGNSGLINIILKKNNNTGMNGSVRAGYEQASYGKGLGGGECNYRSGKLNVYGNMSYTNGANQIRESLATPYPGQWFKVTDDYKRIMKPLQYMAGVDYDIHKNAVAGIQWISNNANREDESNDVIEVFNTAQTRLDSTMITKGLGTRENGNNMLNLNYAWTIDTTGKKLTINANRLWFNGNRINDFTTTHYIGETGLPSGIQTHNAAQGHQDIGITALQADVELPCAFVVMSFGGKLGFIQNNSNNLFGYFDQDGYHEDAGISNSFEYKEKVQALYVSAQRNLGKWSFQAGLRGEFTQTSGYARSLNQTTTNHYFNLFPSAFIQYQPNGDHSWNLNYSKRINRPDYRSLDPFRAYATPYHYSEGNPFLLPSFNHNAELGYTFRSRYSLSVYYQYERNHFASVWMIDTVRNITSGISQNFSDLISYGANASAAIQSFNWWELQVQLGVQRQQLQSKIYTATVQSYNIWSGYAGISNSFVLNHSKTLMAEANCFYLTKYREDFLEINSIGNVDIGLKALLLAKKIVISLNVSDVFATQRAKGLHVVTGQMTNNYFDTRNIRLTIQYKFGSNTIKARRERSTGIEEEKGRAG